MPFTFNLKKGLTKVNVKMEVSKTRSSNCSQYVSSSGQLRQFDDKMLLQLQLVTGPPRST